MTTSSEKATRTALDETSFGQPMGGVMDFLADRWLAIVCVLTFAFRIYLAARVGLSDDESYYWDWSRSLSISYFDHPPMVALLIRLGCFVFGETPLGVRSIGLVCSAASVYLVYKLAEEMFGCRSAKIATLLFLFTPGFALGSLLMVPDVPMIAFWLLFCYSVWKIVSAPETNSLNYWILAGVAFGLGFLSKYSISLLAPSVTIFFLSSAELRKRKLLWSKGFWLALLIAAVLSLPVLIWNFQNGWPSFLFHLRDRQTHDAGFKMARWSQFAASQVVVLSPFLALLIAMSFAWARKNWQDIRWKLIVFLSLPTVLLFSAQALFAEFKPHWPLPGYLLLLIGVAGWISERPRGRSRFKLPETLLALTCGIGLLLAGGFDVALLTPILPKLGQFFSPSLKTRWQPKFDPTNDFYGWPEAARAAERMRAELSRTSGQEAFLASHCYQLVGQLAFASQTRVLRTSVRQDSYNYLQTMNWKSTLKGHDAVLVADERFARDPNRDADFSSCQQKDVVQTFRGHELSHVFYLWICHNYLLPRN